LHRQNDAELCVANHHAPRKPVAIIGRTPVNSAKRSVSSESAGVPAANLESFDFRKWAVSV
jgi:hypothetical protein